MNRLVPNETKTRLRKAYAVALALVAVVTIWSQVVIQWSLRAESTTAQTINEAGLQRMRSQRLTKAAWVGIYSDRRGERERACPEANSAFKALHATQRKLVYESARGRSPHSERSTRMLHDVGYLVERFREPVTRLCNGDRDSALAHSLIAIEGDFLPRMNALVMLFAETAQTRLERVRAVEYGLAALTLTLLLLEAFLIFAPLSRRLVQTERERAALMVRLEADLADSLAENEKGRSAQAVATVASGVAHDLNNYIQVIRSHGELLSTDQDQESVAAIRDASVDAAALCDQLLALNPGLRKTSRHDLSLGELIADTRAMMRSVLPENLVLEIDIARPAPHVRADPQQLRQAILNLCLNARDASLPGGRVVVSVGRTEDGRARVAVRDYGSGIEPAIRDRLFEPFFTTKDIGQGTGLGLAAVEAIVSRHDGTISVRSTPGEGTTFELVFPVIDSPPESTTPAPRSVRRDSALRVLYVEDNEAIRRAGSRLLRAAGHEVTTVSGEQEALAQEAPFDVVISDVVLVDGFGPELLAKLRERRGSLPGVLVSGYTQGWDGVLDASTTFLQKPFSSQDLQAALGRVADASAGDRGGTDPSSSA